MMKSFDRIEGHEWFHCKLFLETEIEDDKYEIARDDSPAHYLLVNEVFRPVLKEFWDGLYLWRFHRQFRSWDEGMREEPPAKPIHQFKFKFYTTQACFVSIEKRLAKALKPLKKAKLILGYETEKSPDSGARIGSDRDTGWDYDIKVVWPYFIHGVSLAWYQLILAQIEHTEEGAFKEGWQKESLERRLQVYRSVKKQLTTLWTREGNGPFLHHMNALFGYHKMWSRISP